MHLAALLLALSSAAAETPCGQEGAQPQWIETVVPRMESADAQLGHARRIKRQMVAKQEDELALWRRRAVEAYQAVRLFHSGAQAACVEAAFRAGEILRAGGDEARALEEFCWAEQHGEGSEFRTRAQLEIGHLHRRAQRWSQALEAYLTVAGDPRASAARREEAWLWAGTSWKAQRRFEDARLAWSRVAEQGTQPQARITAYDELCLLSLESGELEGAAGLLDRCLRTLAPDALEETEEGERVRNALMRMRIVDELPRAIARRRDARVTQGTSRKS